MMISGILLMDKPAGCTSFDVVRRVKKVLRVRKIGHLGTLDPFATGLLPLCIGEATKLAPFLMPEPKTYRGTVKLGEDTDTQDLTGRVTARSEKLPDADEVPKAAARFVGEIEQTPPMFSAVHYQGQRAYKLARRGEKVDLPPRKVTIYRLEVEAVALPEVTITVTCSQGTYIRTLAADLGGALNCGGHLTALRRLTVGAFRVEEALPLAALENLSLEEIAGRIIPLRDCLPGLRPAPVEPEEAQRLRQGQPVPLSENGFREGEQVRVLAAGELVAVAQVRRAAPQAVLAPIRVFLSG
jgi:tRNA pseudouridine55 synthase